MTPQELSNNLYTASDGSQCRATLEASTPEERAPILDMHLADAVRNGRGDLVDLYIEFGVDVNHVPERFGNLLIAGILSPPTQETRLAVVQSLVNAGIDVNSTVKGGSTPLMAAASRGFDDIVRLLIAAGADVHPVDTLDATALCYARRSGNSSTAALLVDAGARVPESAQTDLMVAASWAEWSAVRRLLAAGADPNVRNVRRSTPLMTAIASNGSDDVVMDLLDAGADPRLGIVTHDRLQVDPLKLAVDHNKVAIVKRLVESGVDVNVRYYWRVEDNDADTTYPQSGETPLHIAARRNSTGAALLLLEAGAEIDAFDDNGENVVLAALYGRANDTLELLIAHGAPLDAPEQGRYSLLRRLISDGRDLSREFLSSLLSMPRVRELPDYASCFIVTAGSTEAVNAFDAFLVAGVDVNMVVDNQTALEEALRNHNVHAVERLLQAGARLYGIPSEDDQPRFSPLYRQIDDMSLSTLDLLLDNGVDPGMVLLDAASSKRLDVVTYLLGKGAAVDRVDPRGETALDAAVSAASGRTGESLPLDIVDALIRAGGDVNRPNRFGMTPLMTAISEQDRSDLIEMLLAAGANVDAVTEIRLTPFALASRWEASKCMRVLADAGADIDTLDICGDTPLNYARRENLVETAELLTDMGAVVQPAHAESTLHYAILYNREEAAVRLIDTGVDVEELNPEGMTPLIAAIDLWGNEPIVRRLVDAGADPNRTIIDKYGDTRRPLDFAIPKSGRITDLLLQAGADVPAYALNLLLSPYRWLNWETSPDVEETLRMLIAAGAPVTVHDSYYAETPLHLAVSSGEIELVNILLDAGADIDAATSPTDDPGPNILGGWTPLFNAVIGVRKSPRMVELLIRRGATVNLRNEHDRTPLTYVFRNAESVEPEHILEISRLLVEAGVDVNVPDRSGSTPLDHAIEHSLADVVALLEAHGATRGSAGPWTAVASAFVRHHC